MDMKKILGISALSLSLIACNTTENEVAKTPVTKKPIKVEKAKPVTPIKQVKTIKPKPDKPVNKAATLKTSTPVPYSPGDYFLTFGGGFSPTGNQYSLEKNVEYFNRMRKLLQINERPHYILFSDGKSRGRDLQYTKKMTESEELIYLLATITGTTKGMSFNYRDSNIDNVQGESNYNNINNFITNESKKLNKDSDRLFMYFTGHGGKDRKKGGINTNLYLWNKKNIKMIDFCKLLDKVDPELPVVMFMVQCYSGGFANCIFNEGNPTKGFTNFKRAGFFSTVNTRPASGCTPSINEADYQEYSSYFWAAMCGTNRIGKTVTKPDYDNNGKTSFAEAHAYALIHSDSIDISVKTSDAFLRKYSSAKTVYKDGKKLNTLSQYSDYAVLLKAAKPNEKAILENLSLKLNLTQEKRSTEAYKKAAVIYKKRAKLKSDISKFSRTLMIPKKALFGIVKFNWPELTNPWHPNARNLAEKHKDEISKTLKSNKNYKTYITGLGKLKKMSNEYRALEKPWVKYQRFLKAAENVALINNLYLKGNVADIKNYENLIELENGTFTK